MFHSSDLNLPRKNSKYFIQSSRNNENPEIVRDSLRIHSVCYTDFGYLSKEALDENGFVDKEIDKTQRNNDRGFDVTYLVASDQKTNIPSATLRCITSDQNNKNISKIEKFPAFEYAQSLKNKNGSLIIERLIELSKDSEIVEVSALSSIDARSRIGIYELIRAITQYSYISEIEKDKKVLLLGVMTEQSLTPIIRFMGEDSAELIGEPFQILENDSATASSIKLQTIVFNPRKTIQGILNKYLNNLEKEKFRKFDEFEAPDYNDRKWFLLDGVFDKAIEFEKNI